MPAEPLKQMSGAEQIDQVMLALRRTGLLTHARWLGGAIAEGKADEAMETVRLRLAADDRPNAILGTILAAHVRDPRIRVVIKDFAPISELTLWLPSGWYSVQRWAEPPIVRSMDLAGLQSVIKRVSYPRITPGFAGP